MKNLPMIIATGLAIAFTFSVATYVAYALFFDHTFAFHWRVERFAAFVGFCLGALFYTCATISKDIDDKEGRD